AANLAIAAVSQHLHPPLLAQLDTKTVTAELVRAICQANDRLTYLNNQQQRQERQRMGTTLTLAFVRDYELFVANVGDSRAYWITPYGCYQVTTDDDVASREVRLGYSLYPQAIRQPAAGALVQALGISASNVLHPTIQRLLLDEEDSLLLICSDGLSDNDLVDQYWPWELLPVLRGERDGVAAAQRLIDLANRRNGHDNVTVVLLHYQVDPALMGANGYPAVAATQRPHDPSPPPAAPREPATQKRCPPTRHRPSVWRLGLVGGLLVLATGAVWWWYERPAVQDRPLENPGATVPRFAATPTVITAPGQVNALALDPQGEHLAVSSDDGYIALWSVGGVGWERRLRSAGSPVMGLAFVRQGQQLVSVDRSGLVLWSVPDGRQLGPLTVPKGVVTALATDAVGRFLAVGDANGTIYLWDLQRTVRSPTFTQDLLALGKIDALAVSPNGALVAAGSQGQSLVEVWDVPQRQRRYTFTRPELRQGIWSLAFRPDGQVLAAGSGVDGRIVLWEMTQGHGLRTLKAPGIVYDLLFSPDGAWLITATGTVGEPGIRVWDLADGSVVVTLRGHREAVKHLAITTNGRLLVSGGDDKQVLLWRVQE
ncbi:MAG: protein phosphatase 2C domain-containing protein, partial [Gloeomargarita sp. GMQP_bins_5]